MNPRFLAGLAFASFAANAQVAGLRSSKIADPILVTASRPPRRLR